VLWVVLRKYRKWPFSTAHIIKALETINTNTGVIDKKMSSPSVPSMVNIDVVDSSLHMGEVVGYLYFFFYYLALGHVHSRRRALNPHIFYINRCGLAKDVPFGSFNAKKLYLWEMFQKTPSFFGRNRDSQPKCSVE
jgi:hypothetical protein